MGLDIYGSGDDHLHFGFSGFEAYREFLAKQEGLESPWGENNSPLSPVLWVNIMGDLLPQDISDALIKRMEEIKCEDEYFQAKHEAFTLMLKNAKNNNKIINFSS